MRERHDSLPSNRRSPAPADPSRRRVLRTMGLAGAGWAASRLGAWPLPAFALQDEEVVSFTDIPEDFITRRGDRVLGIDLRELRSWMTPREDLFSVQHYDVPRIDAAGWKLAIEGLVGKPVVLTLAELQKRPRVERTVTFECSGNQASRLHRMVGNLTWAGASLRELLEEAGPSPAAIETIFWAADQGRETIRENEYVQNFARSMSMEDALGSDAILAYEMNGEPLPVEHGYPVRLIVPGWYGIANVKWLERIELSDRRLMNRFMGRDYVTVIGRRTGDRIEWIERSVTRQRVKSVVARVTRSRAAGAETFRVFGVAWTDGTPLRSVEVRVDGGPWRAATIEDRKNPFAWSFWTLDVGPLAAGEHTVVSRATDALGRVQPESLELKKTYWEDNAQFPRTIRVS